ncbi:MAG: type II toxin-antitoxin system VapC family toxin [Thermoprotei archaeon]
MIVLDASFLVKLVIEEQSSTESRTFLKKALSLGEEAATVDIALAEVLNVLWKHVTLIGDLGRDDYKNAVQDLLKLWPKLEIFSTYELAAEAAQIAFEDRITIYDALYITTALKLGAKLITFDNKLKEKAVMRAISTYP